MKKVMIGVILLVSSAVAMGEAPCEPVEMEWVTVGNAGNAADDTGYGNVNYEYRIGKYEVTNGQYIEFLNAIAATDTYGLYNTNMWDGTHGCKIERSGDPGSYSYSVASDRTNRPVNYMSWYDCLRFANWLHNGKRTGLQDSSTTEDGAYTLTGQNSVAVGDDPIHGANGRNARAEVWLPSENEWYKAAYHKNDGVTGNYFDYPTSSDSTPSNDLIDPDPGNNATFYDNGYTIGSPYYFTEVGAHENSDSPYGTFDMGGNVWEWNEALIRSDERSVRGSSFEDASPALSSSDRGHPVADSEAHTVGFRVASLPEPPCGAGFQGLGHLPGGTLSYAWGVSGDGTTAVGQSTCILGTEGFRWTAATGMQSLGDLPGGVHTSTGYDVSSDGSIVVGLSYSHNGMEAHRWKDLNGNGQVDEDEKLDYHPEFALGFLPNLDLESEARAVSADGSVVVGISHSSHSGEDSEAFRWVDLNGNGQVDEDEKLNYHPEFGLGCFVPGKGSFGYGVSADGSVVVGESHSASGYEAVRWVDLNGNGQVDEDEKLDHHADDFGLGHLPGGGSYSVGFDISTDGSVAVGWSDSDLGSHEAFRWTADTGMERLGDLDGGSFESTVWDTSENGSVVVGRGRSALGYEAFVWDEYHGMRNLKGVLVSYGLDLTGWTLTRAYAVSDNGLTIVGHGTDPNGYTEAWIARLCEPIYEPPCWASQEATWQPMDSTTTHYLAAVWGSAPDNVYVVGASGTILHYEGTGDWVHMNSPTTNALLGVWGSSDDDIWAVGGNATILRYQTDNGWQTVPHITTNIQLHDVWGASADDVYAVGQYNSGHGCILHWDGVSWTNEHGPISGPLGAAMQFNGVWGRGPNEIYVVGHNGYSSGLEGVCYKYDGTDWNWEWSGSGWPKTSTFYSIWGTADELFVVGQRFGGPSYWCGELAHYNGCDWSTEIILDTHALWDVWGSANDDVFVTGYSGKILHHDGSTWSGMDSGTAEDLHGIWGTDNADVFAVGTNGTILHLSCNTEPVAICRDVNVPADGNCQGIVTPEDVNDGSYDPDGDPITLTLDPAGPYPLGETLVTLTVSDGAEEATCEATITVTDVTPPVITCPGDVILECPADTDPSATGWATATDNCDEEPSITYSDSSVPGCGDTVIITRTWTATDTAGNNSSCVQVITVQDTTPPVLTVDTTPIEVVDADCSGDENVTLPTASAKDTCGSATVTNDAPATFPAGETTTVTFTATDECGNTSTAAVDVTVLYGANILVRAARHAIGSGSNPGSVKEPLVGITICAYDKSEGSCARLECGGISHRHYECIVSTCAPVNCAVTDENGEAVINLPPGDYVIISDDATKTVLPDPLGVSASDLVCGELKQKYLQQIVKADGKKVPGKTTRRTGSELLIIEPEFVVWDDTQQLYPFVFESVGDWGVTVAVAPPDGFVADANSLSAWVDNEIESLQFTITEVGSDLVPTETTFDVVHKGRKERIRSRVGILLTPDYARSRGFDVAQLRSRGLVKERPANQGQGRGRRGR